jgi:hypothetical protein
MPADRAEIVALNAIQHVAGDERLLQTFLQQVGITPDRLRDGLNDPEVQAGAMDFVMSDDRLALEFCEAFGHAPESLRLVRRGLPAPPDEY